MIQTTVKSPYADYDFYRDVYHGVVILEEDFVRLECRAEEELDAMTFHRIPEMDASLMTDKLELNIRKAVCAIAEVLATDESLGVGISSESNDGYSVSYSQTTQQELKSRKKESVNKYLSDSGLLYRGGGDWHKD